MAGAVRSRHRVVVLAARILVADEHGDRRPQRLTVEHTGQDLDAVAFLALRHQPGLSRPPAIELALKRVGVEREPRRAAIDHHAEPWPVRLAKRRDSEQRPEAVTHAGSIRHARGSAGCTHDQRLSGSGLATRSM